jgi:PAS domain S-box-containing protein
MRTSVSDSANSGSGDAAAPSRDVARGLRDERDRFVGFAFAASDLLLEVSADGHILFAAGAAKAFTGHEAGDLRGTNVLSLIAERDRAMAEHALARARKDGRIEPMTFAFTGGEEGGVNATVSACLLPEKGDSLYLAIVGARPAVPDAALQGTRDAETGLLDAASFRAAARDTIVAAKAVDQTLELGLLRLQGLDDLHERAKGEAWNRLAGEIGAFLRTHSFGGNTAGRFDEDKFGVIRSRAATKIVLSNEIERLSRIHDPSGTGIRANEVGVDLDTAGISSDDAAKALAFTLSRFTAERGDAFSIRSLAQAFRAHIADTVNRISRLKAATDTSKMTVAFQPIVGLDSRLLHHYEMLARFDQHKSPFEMIQFAEKVGMIEEIDLAMCQRALLTLEDYAAQPIDLAVNVSGRSLDSDMFVEALTKLLEPHAALSRHLLFEITESNAMSDLQRAERILAELRRQGYRICLDDFGSGASSFPYLQALSLDFVKIDGTYVARMRDSAKDRAIVKAMVAMCQDLGIGIIAEMVERVDQAEELMKMGIRYGQGFLFGRPSPSPASFVPALGNAPLPEQAAASRARKRT